MLFNSVHTSNREHPKKYTGDNWWQVVYGAGAILGGYLSSSGVVTGPPRDATPNGVPLGYALIGGTILIFGARLAGGCASGHGLTGISILSLTSCAFDSHIPRF